MIGKFFSFVTKAEDSTDRSNLFLFVLIFFVCNVLSSFIVFAALYVYSPNTMTSGDWGYYSSRNISFPAYNGGFSVFIWAFKLVSPVGIGSVILAKFITNLGFVSIILPLEGYFVELGKRMKRHVLTALAILLLITM